MTCNDAAGNVMIPTAGAASYAVTVGDDSCEADALIGNGVFYRNSRTRMEAASLTAQAKSGVTAVLATAEPSALANS